LILTRSLVLVLGLTLAAPAADTPLPKGYVCGRAAVPIVMDGKLDDPAWKDAPWTDDFVDIVGDARPRPRFRTRAKMLWDDTYFYVAAELLEPHVWGTLTKHDSVIFHDNDFEVFIDPDGDNHEYYELEINALNTEWDLLLEKPYRDGGPAVDAWEVPGLKTATHVNGKLNDPDGEDESWTVELAIPWEALKPRANRPTPPKDGDQWRVNFSRVEWEHTVEGQAYKKVPNRPEDNWVWSPQGAVDMHRPERWGFVQFSTQAPGQAGYDLDPAGPVRDRLMKVYHEQRAYREKAKAWAPTLEALGLAGDNPLPGTEPPTLRITPEGFEAEITLRPSGGHPRQTWIVRQDSRLTRKSQAN
jgi:Carbohydrate family 9 binding domain-like